MIRLAVIGLKSSGRASTHLGHDDLDRSTFTSSERRQFHMTAISSCSHRRAETKSHQLPFPDMMTMRAVPQETDLADA